MSEKKSVFETLSAINCNGHTEKKNGLTYLAWAWAWQMVKEHYPNATYTIYEDANGCIYHSDGATCWVKTGVTIEGIEMIEYLPVMDFRNASIPKAKVTSFDANKAVQRSLTKACARHGLGLYIYAGEDIPEADKSQKAAAKTSEDVPAKKVSKPAKNPKMVQAWKDFSALESSRSLSDTAKTKMFVSICKEHVEKSDPNSLSDEEWDVVLDVIRSMSEEVLV